MQEESGVESKNISVSGSQLVSLYQQHCCLVYPSDVCWLSLELGSGANIYCTWLFCLDLGVLGIISLSCLLLQWICSLWGQIWDVSHTDFLWPWRHNLEPLYVSLTFCDKAGLFMYIFLCALYFVWGVPNTHDITGIHSTSFFRILMLCSA